ncbi:MAG: leucine-rich repeat protein [Spirochaetaceae bacterium]|nr:leucine-rich repeat protein [Spirochaetaceae bacterium]
MKKGFFFGLAVILAAAATGCNIQTHLPDPDTAGEADLRLNKSVAGIIALNTLKLQASASVDAWTSSDETVAMVNSNGLVVAVSPGRAVITASAKGKTADCAVSVVSSFGDFAEWLAALPENTAATPYWIQFSGDLSSLENNSIALYNLFALIENTGRYVGIDLSGSPSSVINPTNVILFPNYAKLVEAILPEGLTSLGQRTFYGARGLQRISLPPGLTTIGSSAFQGCTSLTEINLEGITSIGSQAFQGCTSLTKVTLPSSLTDIGMGSQVFSGCTSLAEVVILPSSRITIGSYTFKGCTSLTKVTLPEGITIIGGEVFQDCTSLRDLTLPGSVTRILNDAFHGCTSLTNINLPEGLTYINNGAFKDCTGLREVTLPSTLREINSRLFEGCTNLRTLIFLKTTPPTYRASIEEPFGNTHPDLVIKVPADSVEAYRTATGWNAYASIITAR